MANLKARTEMPAMPSAEATEYQRPLLINATKTAILLDLSKPQVHKLANAGILPSVRIGRSVRFSLTAIEAWIRERAGAN